MIFPIQSAIVGLFSDFDPLYLVVTAVILALAIGLNRLGAHLRGRRTRQAAGVAV